MTGTSGGVGVEAIGSDSREIPATKVRARRANAFIFNIENFIPSSLSNSSMTRNTLNIPIGSSIQIEGIFALDQHTVYLSSEQHISGVSSLYRFQLNTTNLCEQRIEKIIVCPNPATDYIELFNKKNSKKTIIDSQGNINFVTNENFINLQNLKRGKYYIQVECFDSTPTLQTSFVIQ